MRHIDSDLLLRVLEGQLPPRTLLRVLCEHLKDLCPECGANLELLVEGDEDLLRAVASNAESQDGVARYATAFHNAGCTALASAGELGDERRRAKRDFRELLALAPAERAPRVASAHTRFRSRSLVDLLLEESRRAARQDPAEARSLAELVPVVLHWTPGAAGSTWAEEAYLRSLSLRGNALRVAGDLREADSAFRDVRHFLASHPVDDEILHAEVSSLEASLRSDQRRLDEAEKLLDRAILLYRAAGDTAGVAKNLVKRGEVQRLNERLSASAESLREALGLLDPADDRHLYLCAVGNLGLHLCDVGRADEAAELLATHDDLLRAHQDDWMNLRMTVVRGRIAHGQGRSDEAEHLFLAARRGYMARDLGYDAASVTLDLAVVYLEQGRARELKEAALMMQPIFEAREVHREALAALMLFEQAAAAEQVTEETIHRLRRYLERTRSESRPPTPPS
jgi:tetratricopeptide (TPR) repeat protein